MSETSPKCSRCGTSLPPDAPEGLCPRCLVALNLATQTDVTSEGGPHGTTVNKPPPAPPLPPAEIAKLFPQLEILECLGRGGMGAVYKARQPRLDRLVALKILSPEKQDDPKFAERFEREARALARLNHPNIVTVYDFGFISSRRGNEADVPPSTTTPPPHVGGYENKTGGIYYLLMEFVDGLTLRQLFHTRKLAARRSINIVPKICEALQYAHNEGIVHRDIKPENILLDKQGRVKIADFGIAKIIGQTPKDVSLTGAKDVVGTPHYMAPEQIEKPATVDHRADIYSLGVVFYEMLTGELPLGKFQPPSAKVQIDVRLDEVVLHALEKEPERRYQQASQMQTAVETIVRIPNPDPVSPPHSASEKPDQPPPMTKAISTTSGTMKTLMTAAAIVLAFLLLAAVFAVGSFLIYRSAQAPGNAAPQHSPTHAPAVSHPSARLSYQWKQGRNFAYSVRVEATANDYIETVTGNVFYNVITADADQATLSCRSHLSPAQRRAIPGKTMPLSIPYGIGHFWSGAAFGGRPREIQVDSTGRILSHTGDNTALPQALGVLELLAFEPLSPDAAGAWENENDCAVTSSETAMPFPHLERSQRTTLPAHEKATYRITEVSGNTVRIHKQYELQTQEKTGGEPRLRLTGEGTILFDTGLGLARTTEFKGMLVEIDGNTTWRTPLTLTCQLLEGAENAAASAPSATVETGPKELTAVEVEKAVADLKSSDWSLRQNAAGRLAQAKPVEPKDEVVQGLAAALTDPNWSVRQKAAEALGNWGTTGASRPLIKALEDPEFSIRWAAMDALARLKVEAAATPMSKHLTVAADAMQAGQALIALGPAAEGAVAKLLSDSSVDARREACRVLKEIGTAKSAPALEAAAADTDGIVAMLAREALRTVSTRSTSNQPHPSK